MGRQIWERAERVYGEGVSGDCEEGGGCEDGVFGRGNK